MAAGVKTLADGRLRLTALLVPPADPKAITLAELDDGIEIACHIMKSDYRISATGSTMVTQTELCKKGQGNTPGPSQYEGTLSPFWYLQPDGSYDQTDDEMLVYETLRNKGTELTLVEREGPESDVPWAADDYYDAFQVVTDEPQVPTDRNDGFIYRTVPLGVQWKESGRVAAGGGG